MPAEGRYVGENLGHERINNLKCYFVQSDNPKYRYSDTKQYRKTQIESRGRVIADKLMGVKGFALVWKPDVIVGTPKHADERFLGFELKHYDFEEKPTFCSIEAELGSGVHFTDPLCPMNAMIIGKENEFFLDSKSPQDYYKKWVLQKRFEQKHGFKL